MLQHYKQEIEDCGDGWFIIRTLDEIEDDPCTICGGESVFNECEADGKAHHHGKIHNIGPDGTRSRLEARCGAHAKTRNECPII